MEVIKTKLMNSILFDDPSLLFEYLPCEPESELCRIVCVDDDTTCFNESMLYSKLCTNNIVNVVSFLTDSIHDFLNISEMNEGIHKNEKHVRLRKMYIELLFLLIKENNEMTFYLNDVSIHKNIDQLFYMIPLMFKPLFLYAVSDVFSIESTLVQALQYSTTTLDICKRKIKYEITDSKIFHSSTVHQNPHINETISYNIQNRKNMLILLPGKHITKVDKKLMTVLYPQHLVTKIAIDSIEETTQQLQAARLDAKECVHLIFDGISRHTLFCIQNINLFFDKHTHSIIIYLQEYPLLLSAKDFPLFSGDIIQIKPKPQTIPNPMLPWVDNMMELPLYIKTLVCYDVMNYARKLHMLLSGYHEKMLMHIVVTGDYELTNYILTAFTDMQCVDFTSPKPKIYKKSYHTILGVSTFLPQNVNKFLESNRLPPYIKLIICAQTQSDGKLHNLSGAQIISLLSQCQWSENQENVILFGPHRNIIQTEQEPMFGAMQKNAITYSDAVCNSFKKLMLYDLYTPNSYNLLEHIEGILINKFIQETKRHDEESSIDANIWINTLFDVVRRPTYSNAYDIRHNMEKISPDKDNKLLLRVLTRTLRKHFSKYQDVLIRRYCDDMNDFDTIFRICSPSNFYGDINLIEGAILCDIGFSNITQKINSGKILFWWK